MTKSSRVLTWICIVIFGMNAFLCVLGVIVGNDTLYVAIGWTCALLWAINSLLMEKRLRIYDEIMDLMFKKDAEKHN